MSGVIDDPGTNDNRHYDYVTQQDQQRAEYPIIVAMVKSEASVVDFGCGNGSLLKQLQIEKQVAGLGYDVAQSGVDACMAKGISARCMAIDQFHPELNDRQFDYAICNVTIQMVMYPERLLKEMARVARQQIVSFPNFAFYRNRMDMALHGRMPQPMLFGYTWYATGHIHQLSIYDFYALVRDVSSLRIKFKHQPQSRRWIKKWMVQRFPNFFEEIPVFLLESSL